MEDTICAISTPLGTGGVAIIRVSGPNALKVAKRCFVPFDESKDFIPRYMRLGFIQAKQVRDHCLCVYFKAPNSFTGEDVVEFQFHGGFYLAKTLLQAVIGDGSEVRLAQNGEFSKRAVMNGKMDISQAEGVIDIINAVSEAELKSSANLMQGRLGEKITQMQSHLRDIICEIDVALDYPEHDIEYITAEKAAGKLEKIIVDLNALIDSAPTGQMVKNGVNVALIGNPNAGKSSLLNALLGYDRAIVTDIAGTTRDTLEESYEYNGVRFNIVDTAGIRESEDIVERAGVERALGAAQKADVVVRLIDPTVEIGTQVLPQNCENIITIVNKSDLFCAKIKENTQISDGLAFISAPKNRSERVLNAQNNTDFIQNLPKTYQNNLKGLEIDLFISAKTGENVQNLKQLIFDKSINYELLNSNILITNVRHLDLLRAAAEALTKFTADYKSATLDCLVLFLQDAWMSLGQITGETANESILNEIFARFCLGK